MIVVVTGSRSIADKAAIGRIIKEAVTGPVGGWGTLADVVELWHGDCPKGVDRLAAAWAEEHGIKVVPWPVTEAEWEASKYLAGKRRNYRMVKAASKDPRHAIVVGVWDWVSGGTSHAIACASACGLPVYTGALRQG